MKQLGFPRSFVNDAQKRRAAAEAVMLQLARVQGWEVRDVRGRERSDGPSMAMMAQAGGLERLYDFLYSATSRSVHFSLSELLRCVWGSPTGQMTIASTNFHTYWTVFALYWGAHIFIHLLPNAIDLINISDGDIEDSGAVLQNEYMSAVATIGDFGKVPAVTVEELRGPWNPQL